MWVRGLKLYQWQNLYGNYWSHPMWVRGLKHHPMQGSMPSTDVAPHVGAWIETSVSSSGVARIVSRTPCGCVD